MRALISVTDKTGVAELAKNLQELGYEIISTGGTLKAISESGVEVKDISSVTNFPEILDGRVKTLSPYVHGAILYKRDNPDHEKTVKEHNIESIDIVVVNLYNFENALGSGDHDNIIENIDIGGPSMVRSAAKNYKDVLIVTDPKDYDDLVERLKNGSVDLEYREKLAMKAFSLTAYYDSVISRYFQERSKERFGEYKTYGFKRESSLRYGENPQQDAALYIDPFVKGKLTDCKVIHGKEMSFNNYNDLNVAVELANELGENSCVALKHQSPCGVAIGESIHDAYHKAYLADPLSIFGGIVAINGVVDKETAEEMHEIFLEIVAAKDFTDEALEVLESKKNIRLVKINFDNDTVKEDIKYLNGKALIQGKDFAKDEFNVITETAPTEEQAKDLKFAMTVVKYTKSNAIVLAKDGKTLGVGGGQTSRIWALEAIANNHPDTDFSGAVLASDAFFPFSDCVEFANKIGVKSIIQPGGSKRDQESIDKCNEFGISMVFTNNRHFRH
ncbi:MAG: bifunctional phosphoribosylaminoimidazolecarboxamide formyltransferase/IMP cyclohydrolase [Finegoldia sp.]|nr:bifunctional phosphoribosylaminoimidazolecarboxamide formyltransferase/IMP cyclohydrolase [Finegoldia sp.]